MKKHLLVLCLAILFNISFPVFGMTGKVQKIATRDGVTVPIYVAQRPDAVATVVLFSGGSGGYGKLGEDGWPAGDNFLIRAGKSWIKHPFNVVMVGRPSDGIDLGLGGIRAGAEHGADNQAILQAIRRETALPLWLVGTSMGTISVAAAAIRDEQRLIAGIVLSSSITAYKIPGAIPTQDLEKIRVPTLVFHHENDACGVCKPHEAKQIEKQLKNAPQRKTLLVTGGAGPTGNACGPFHFHGFIGMEEQAVDLIARWILAPAD